MPSLEVQGLSAWYGAAQALFDVSLHVAPGEFVVLQGLNGAGKSTLLMSVAGLVSTQGDIRLDGRDIAGLAPFERAQQGLGWVPEDRRLFGGLSVIENLTVAVSGDYSERLESILTIFPVLRKIRTRLASDMSGGEQQMLSIARTLMGAPKVLLLDEPCEGIAPVLVESISETIIGLKSQGVTLLVAEQNSLLSRHADRVITLTGGQIAGNIS